MESAVLDPLAPAPNGTWSGPGVRVSRRRGPHRQHRGSPEHRHGSPDLHADTLRRPAAPAEAVCTPRFCVQRRGSFLTVEHDLHPDELCDELAVMLADELVDRGAIRTQAEFELVFTGIVRSTVDGGMAAWLRFYRNSLAKLESGTTPFAPVHAW